jgi:hypothetical protein
MRFGLARLWVIWRKGNLNTGGIADMLDFGPFDRKMLAILGRAPLFSSFLALAWMTIRMRPFGAIALAGAWWRALHFRWFGKVTVQRQVDTIVNCANGKSSGLDA